MMAYDPAGTRRRLLDAAYREFSDRGLAGARVDRIADAAKANKQAIYAYYGSKDELFDAVLANRLGVLADTVPFTPEDLPGYAGALFDALTATPDLLRLTRWRELERAVAGPAEVESHLAKARALQGAAGLPDERTAIDVLEIVIAITTAWLGTDVKLREIGATDLEQRRQAHRELVVTAAAGFLEKLTRD